MKRKLHKEERTIICNTTNLLQGNFLRHDKFEILHRGSCFPMPITAYTNLGRVGTKRLGAPELPSLIGRSAQFALAKKQSWRVIINQISDD